jgi:hypothetical protein
MMCNWCCELSMFRLYERVLHLPDQSTSISGWAEGHRAPFYDELDRGGTEDSGRTILEQTCGIQLGCFIGEGLAGNRRDKAAEPLLRPGRTMQTFRPDRRSVMQKCFRS